MTASSALAPDELRRADALFAESLHRRRVFSDRIFARLLVLQWLFGMLAAVLISPRTWEGGQSKLHVHVAAAAVGGALIAALPLALIVLRPGAGITRHVIAAAQMITSALLIHLTGGRIETHFHVFGSLAFLAFYLDWRVLATATGIVAADHFLRGVYWPRSVFGVETASPYRWMEHGAWVVFEDVFLVLSIHQGLREMRVSATRRAEVEAAKKGVEATVAERTRELADARDAARAADQAKSAFLANMSHEIRTPMTAILGFADLLDDANPTAADAAQRAEAIRTIQRNGRHLLALINDILDLSRIEAGRMPVESLPCSPVQIVEDVRSLMQVRAHEKALALRVEYEFPLPRSIRTDPVRFKQILMNLVGNAIKFTERGSVEVRVRLADAAGPAPRLEVAVTDTGIGLSPDQLERLFEPFTQADTSTSRKFGGTGLGLTISRHLARLMGGDVTARSEPGRGSTFTLTLPAGAVGPGNLIHAAGEAAESHAPARPAAGTTLRARVLLAEDGPDNQRLISLHLRRAGAEVVIADNGRAAVDAALGAAAGEDAAGPFDVILMDMQMPVLDGYAAVAELRRRGYARPIIALTAHAMSGDEAKCRAAGCDDYLTKPIAPGMLIERCAAWSARGRGGLGAAAAPAPPAPPASAA